MRNAYGIKCAKKVPFQVERNTLNHRGIEDQSKIAHEYAMTVCLYENNLSYSSPGEETMNTQTVMRET